MPGIFGFISKSKQEKHSDLILEEMSHNLRHFEFYMSEQISSRKAGIGKIDVPTRFHGPIHTDPQTGIIVCLSGEIYDYVNTGDSLALNPSIEPEKVIISIYQRYGRKTPNKINGDFNIAIYDPREDILMIFNDRFGYRHLYMYEDQSIFMFAPEIKAFMFCPQFDKTLDEHGIADYFNFSYHMGDRTMFRKVRLLPPASCLLITKGETKQKTYWEPKYKNERVATELSESIETGYHLFCQSIERRLSGEDVIIPLSGGLDSRLILAVANDLGCKITAVTFGIKGCLDHEIAKRVCDALDLEKPRLVTIEPSWVQEFARDVVFFNECNYASLGLTTQHGFAQTMGSDYDCFLNGIFGGHLSFGSPYFTEADLHSNYTPEERTGRIIRGLNGYRSELFMKNCVSSELNDILNTYRKKTVHEEWDKTETKSDLYAFRQDNLFLHNRIRRGMNTIDQNRFFYNDQLPFASYELYDFFLTLSPDLMLDHYLYKEIYKTKLPHLARIPWQATGVNLYRMPSMLQRMTRELRKQIHWYAPRLSMGKMNVTNKYNYEDLSLNYRKHARLREWIENILLSDQCLGRGYFQQEGVIELLNAVTRGRSAFHEISIMVMFELWVRNSVD